MTKEQNDELLDIWGEITGRKINNPEDIDNFFLDESMDEKEKAEICAEVFDKWDEKIDEWIKENPDDEDLLKRKFMMILTTSRLKEVAKGAKVNKA